MSGDDKKRGRSSWHWFAAQQSAAGKLLDERVKRAISFYSVTTKQTFVCADECDHCSDQTHGSKILNVSMGW